MRRNLNLHNPNNVITVSSLNANFKSIQDAINHASSGNLIIVYPGTYNEQLILKNGVNIECKPGVTISSSNAGGTIIDNNIAVTVSLMGFPTITNTNGLHKRIVLQNASSVVSDFWWEFLGRIYQSDTDNPGIDNIIKNTLGGLPALQRTEVGTFRFVLTAGFTGNNKTYFSSNNFTDNGGSVLINVIPVFQEGSTLEFNYLNGTTPIDGNEGIPHFVNIKVYP